MGLFSLLGANFATMEGTGRISIKVFFSVANKLHLSSIKVLAFSLALNKIYAGDSFQTILIDDPIQCMDDINMISFVELLRREFGQSQIILSTHEDTFSNYISYKFQKYGLSQQTITLKDSQ